MLTWFQKLWESTCETKMFIFTTILYTAGVLLPVIYCYARLDFVRSYAPPHKVSESLKSEK